ncbi:origin recognition complex subunit 1 [Terfezia boudieri ATCC MYA-4762]|uniref:Origin recognition complex subunit 1 n=1 Tax=Terfezia boudieri ATCC MYA-4762 TaxID=1051890 RepID=A0A3N4LZP9_9PEZI|nr:origin recognition complex subunit 1 [Terfezia boudieri ATCC MYA-4762]
MPPKKGNSSIHGTPPQKKSNIDHARKLLRGVVREDSDDELGVEDVPWEWIYGGLADPNTPDDDSPMNTPSKKRRSQREAKSRKIIGAKIGNRFECQIGDCLLIKGEGLSGEAYVGMACEFTEENGEMECNVMWFSTEFEIKSKNKRTDYLPHELYINPSWNKIPLYSINGRAIILSQQKYREQYPNGVQKNSKQYGKVFICRRGCAPRTATYTEEFIWEDIYKGRGTDIDMIVRKISDETKLTRKGRHKPILPYRESPGLGDDFIEKDSDFDELDDSNNPRTPRKRQKTSAAVTPSRRTPSSKFTTPTHKRVVIKKALEFTPLGTRILPTNLFDSPYALARNRLHVSAVPAFLPCREAEFSEVYTHLEDAISEGSGSCIYISGTPGTGKTATVREVIAQLQASVASEELDDFIFVEINGMKIADPHQSYSLLWEAIKGERVTPAHALALLAAEFSRPSPRRVPCVVLMDELDQLVTKNQGVMYNFFNWPGVRHSRLIVLAVANTMDLPERTLSNKISSRLDIPLRKVLLTGLTRITFPGYTHDQLMKIIQSRLGGVPGNIVDSDAIQFASRKVAAVSGDARRALDICRRAVEIVEYASGKADSMLIPGTPSKRGRGPINVLQSTKARPIGSQGQGRVTIAVIKQAINEATSSPLQQYLHHLPLTAKVFLAAILARIRRSGVGENIMADVIDEAERMAKMAGDFKIEEMLLSTEVIGGKGVVGGGRVAGLMSAAIMLMEAGVIGLEMKKGERAGRVRLSVGEEEVLSALRDDREMGRMIGS